MDITAHFIGGDLIPRHLNFLDDLQITANGGFFLANLFSFLEPTPLTVQTPPEMQPYGWTTTDIWCAPLITGLYAFLTHAQPAWADIHKVLSEFLGMQAEGKQVLPLDPEVARANCALILALLFTGRAVNRFGILKFRSFPGKSACHFSASSYELRVSAHRSQDQGTVEIYTSFLIPCLHAVVHITLEFDERVWIPVE